MVIRHVIKDTHDVVLFPTLCNYVTPYQGPIISVDDTMR